MNRTVIRPDLRAALLLTAALLLSLFTGCYPKTETKAPSEAPVTVRLAKPQVGGVTEIYETTGHTDTTPVLISPRVRGTLEEICFEPGAIVNEGDVLFKIEQFDYKVKVDTANADCYIAKAEFDRAQAEYNRQVNMDAKGPGITTKEDVEKAKAALESARGKVESTRVALEQAKKDLERTVIYAPCRGKINKADVEVGDLLDGTTGTPVVLTTIVSMDPMYVYFQISDSEFNKLRTELLELAKKTLGDAYDPSKPLDTKQMGQILEEHKIEMPIKFMMHMPGDPEGEYPHEGVITYSENTANRNTGTMTMRAEVANADYTIFPGMICNVRITGDDVPGAVTIQEKAVCHDLSDTYVWVLDANGRPRKQLIETGKTFDSGMCLVTSGLTGDETYITDGILQVRSGCLIQEADDAGNAAGTAAPAGTAPAAEPQTAAPQQESAN